MERAHRAESGRNEKGDDSGMKAIYKLVQDIMPEATASECVLILNRTSYPFSSMERLEHEIYLAVREYRREKVQK